VYIYIYIHEVFCATFGLFVHCMDAHTYSYSCMHACTYILVLFPDQFVLVFSCLVTYTHIMFFYECTYIHLCVRVHAYIHPSRVYTYVNGETHKCNYALALRQEDSKDNTFKAPSRESLPAYIQSRRIRITPLRCLCTSRFQDTFKEGELKNNIYETPLHQPLPKNA
jgi:hypothetical protein